MTTCPRCAQPVHTADRFCESCGAALAGVSSVAIPRPGRGAGPCTDCGGPVAAAGGGAEREPAAEECASGEVRGRSSHLRLQRGVRRPAARQCGGGAVD